MTADIEWETPHWLFKDLDEEFAFGLDVCAMPWNAKVERYYTPSDDAIEQPWSGVCWMNPPYGRDLELWVAKAWGAAQCGATVVCLLPARVETAWFHELVLGANETDTGADEIRFIRGRLTFEGAAREARFASIVVVFRPRAAGEKRVPAVRFIDPDEPDWGVAPACRVIEGECEREVQS